MRRFRWNGLLAAALFGVAGSTVRGGYHVEDVALPPEVDGGLGAIAFTPGGTLVVATRAGELWMRSADGGPWRWFASGLDEPMGLVAESETVVHVAHRPELLRCADTDGDGRADYFTALGGEWGMTHNYHEFFFGLRRAADGSFLGALSLESQGDRDDNDLADPRGPLRLHPDLEGRGHRASTRYRGWAIRITPEGRFEPLAAGLRQPNGVGLGPEGDFFVTDNQGDWKPSGGVIHVERGDFLGHASSLKWAPGFDAEEATAEALWPRLKPPAVVLPQGAMGISNGEIVWDLTGGRFGPFGGQAFVGDHSAVVMRISLERVGGAWQGAAYPFLGPLALPGTITGAPLRAGGTRMAFGPDGALHLAQTAGWGAGGDGLQRISRRGEAAPEMERVELRARGFRVVFTEPIEAGLLGDPANFELHRFRHYYHHGYGSPRIDTSPVGILHARPASDGRSVELEIEGLEAGFVYELSVARLRARRGSALSNPIAYYTANRLLTGEIAIGGTMRPPREGEQARNFFEAEREAPVDPAALVARGEGVYRMYCSACHQPDGRGLPGGAADFVGDAARLAKDDAQLLRAIVDGVEGTGMPGFGSILGAGEQQAVLAYLRATFGAKVP